MSEPNLQPVLKGQSITVRPITADDWEALYSAAGDPKLWAQHPANDRWERPVFRNFFDAAIASGTAFVFVDDASHAIVGSSRYNGYDSKRSEIEIGWTFIARSHWGGTANAEVKTLMLDHAFNFVETVLFWVGETNHRSRGAMQKLGGVMRDGVHHRALAGDAPHVIFEISRSRWKAQPLG